MKPVTNNDAEPLAFGSVKKRKKETIGHPSVTSATSFLESEKTTQKSKQKDREPIASFAGVLAKNHKINGDFGSTEKDIEAKADELILESGYKIFGSLFSMVEQQMQATKEDEVALQSASQLLFKKDGWKFDKSVGAEEDRIHSIHSDQSVVIDFAKIRDHALSEKQKSVTYQRSPDRDDVRSASSALDQEEIQSETRIKPRHSENEGDKPVIEDHYNRESSVKHVRETKHVLPILSVDAVGDMLLRDGEKVQATTSVSLPSGAEQIAEKVIVSLRSALQALPGDMNASIKKPFSNQTLRMDLQPIELGRVDISISRRGNRLDVTVVAERPETAKILAEDSIQLERLLDATKLDVEFVKVTVGTSESLSETNLNSDRARVSAHDGFDAHTSGDRYARESNSNTKDIEELNAEDDQDLPLDRNSSIYASLRGRYI